MFDHFDAPTRSRTACSARKRWIFTVPSFSPVAAAISKSNELHRALWSQASEVATLDDLNINLVIK